jgi:hypothetical protein
MKFYALQRKGHLDEFTCRDETLDGFSKRCTNAYWRWYGQQSASAPAEFKTIDHWMKDKIKVVVTVEDF